MSWHIPLHHRDDEAWDDLNWSHPVDCEGCQDCDEQDDECAA